jgi:hypothetical protein
MSVADQAQRLERLQLGKAQQQGSAAGEKKDSSCVTYHQFVVSGVWRMHQ